MKYTPLRFALMLMFLGLVSSVLHPAAAQDPAAAVNAAPASAGIEGFDQALGSYRDALVAIEELRGAYQMASAEEKKALSEQLPAKVAAAKKCLNALIDVGVATYEADPKCDKRVSDLLLTVARYDVVGKTESEGGDQYERGLKVIKALIDGGQKKAELPVWGMVAAYAANDLDLAAKYRDLASETGAFAAAPNEKDTAAVKLLELAAGMAANIEPQREMWAAEQAIRATEEKADNLPRVKLTTTKGEIVLELFEDQAPQAVANFITLVKSGFYTNVVFHRVLSKFMAQGGDPRGTGRGGPGYNIRCECYRKDYRHHFRGTLSMAHAGRDTGGSQFFLTFVPTPFLDGRHTAFGRVIEGMEVLADLQRIDPDKPGPIPPDKILSAEVLRDRGHSYEFEKLPGR